MSDDLSALKALAEKGIAEVIRLCSIDGERRISIPARPDYDTDLVLIDALDSFIDLIAKHTALIARVSAAEAGQAEAWDEGAKSALSSSAYAHINPYRLRAVHEELDRSQVRVLVTHPHDGHGPNDTCTNCSKGADDE